MFSTLAWIYWNPPKNIFTIPFFDRPIAWYGVLFVLGFILGYFIILSLFDRFIKNTKALSPIDIEDWQPIIQEIESNKNDRLSTEYQIYQNLDSETRDKLSTFELKQELDEATKQKLLASINYIVLTHNIDRKTLIDLFPKAIATTKQTAYKLVDYLCWFVVLGTLIGARLGVVFFYDWPYFREHPLDIFKTWEGGLASHGGTIGLLLAIYLYTLFIRKKIPYLSFLNVIDFVAVPTALAAVFIRIGNFVNQEILGTPSTLPWAIIFGNPIDGSVPEPRHPVQLYEAIAYLGIFIFLYTLWKKKGDSLSPGMLSGLLLILVFSSRFILEFWKETQSSFIETQSLQMGQLLSLPFVILGFFLIWYGKRGYLFKNRYF